MNGAHLIFYIVSGLTIWGVFRFETWRTQQRKQEAG